MLIELVPGLDLYQCILREETLTFFDLSRPDPEFLEWAHVQVSWNRQSTRRMDESFQESENKSTELDKKAMVSLKGTVDFIANICNYHCHSCLK